MGLVAARCHAALGAQIAVVAVRGILGEEVVGDADDEQRDAGDDHGQPPAHEFADPEHQEGREDERHDHLRNAAAEVAPPRGGGVGGAHAVGGEHHRRVVLGNDERRADGADGQPEEQEGFIALRQADAHDRQ